MILNQVQLEVLRQLAEGKTNRQIARDMSYSQQSVKRHVSIIMRKLKADSRAHAVTLAIRRGLIDLPDRPDVDEDASSRRVSSPNTKPSRYDEAYAELKREIALLTEQVAILVDLMGDSVKSPTNPVSYRMLAARKARRAFNLN